MKFGIRKPSIKKSISARTTGKAKRKLKRLTNPLYGKKGMGLITNPKKSLYNRAYRKTTISAKGASGCIAACIYYPMYYSCLIMWWALKYTAIGLWILGIFLVNCIISLIEFCVNLKDDSDAPEESVPCEDPPQPIQLAEAASATDTVSVETKPDAPSDQESKDLKERVVAVLKQHPEILQTDVYKAFDPSEKTNVSSILYFLAQDGTISREKSGRTYKINLN